MPAREKTRDWLEAGGRGLPVRKAAGRLPAQHSVRCERRRCGPCAVPGSGPSAPGGDARLFPQDAQGQGVGGDEQLGQRPTGGGGAGTAPQLPRVPGAGCPRTGTVRASLRDRVGGAVQTPLCPSTTPAFPRAGLFKPLISLSRKESKKRL